MAVYEEKWTLFFCILRHSFFFLTQENIFLANTLKMGNNSNPTDSYLIWKDIYLADTYSQPQVSGVMVCLMAEDTVNANCNTIQSSSTKNK